VEEGANYGVALKQQVPISHWLGFSLPQPFLQQWEGQAEAAFSCLPFPSYNLPAARLSSTRQEAYGGGARDETAWRGWCMTAAARYFFAAPPPKVAH